MDTPKLTSRHTDWRRQGSAIRRPVQERGRKKFEQILQVTESFLEFREPGDISIYDIAYSLNTAPPSVYHFFPDVSLVFVALAERYLQQITEVCAVGSATIFVRWETLLDAYFDRVLMLYRTRPAMRKVLLGLGYTPEIRRLDIDNNRIAANYLLEALRSHFVVPEISDLCDRVSESISISDSIWTLHLHRHGEISELARQRASDARNAYLKNILPDMMPRR
ncbi:TetR/AcrR family transcriptional regulator [Paraburkholderia bannensis]|uniref:TetR/AcrR family transcriptional regulator n=1 Tax=Paraburkholderia bannensis TaxID=765414 RepID=UPI0038B9EFB4